MQKIKLKNNTGFLEIKNIKINKINKNQLYIIQNGGKYGGEQVLVDNGSAKMDADLENMFNILSKYE
jgi:hypothetical protein